MSYGLGLGFRVYCRFGLVLFTLYSAPFNGGREFKYTDSRDEGGQTCYRRMPCSGYWNDWRHRLEGNCMQATWYLGGLEGHGYWRLHGWDARALQRRGRRDRRHGDTAGAIMDETDRRCNQPRQGGGEQNAVPSGHANPAHTRSLVKKRAHFRRRGLSNGLGSMSEHGANSPQKNA
jgi:hypothetical protein